MKSEKLLERLDTLYLLDFNKKLITIVELRERTENAVSQFKKELELKILQDTKMSFMIQSDLSTKTHGYRRLCERIEQLINQ